MIKRLAWDSDFFKLNVGELQLEEYNGADLSEYDLIYGVSKVDISPNINGFNCSFSEQKIIFAKALADQNLSSGNVVSYRRTDYKINDIYRLAFESGKYSRFLLDINFEPGKFEELYRNWIDNSMESGFADDVLLYVESGEILGLLTYKTKGSEAQVGLIAVAPEQQGRGVGSTLLEHLEAELYEKQAGRLTIPTQFENQGACSFYSSKGYEVSERNFIKHYWRHR